MVRYALSSIRDNRGFAQDRAAAAAKYARAALFYVDRVEGAQ